MNINLSKLTNNVDGVYSFDSKIINHDLNEVLEEFEIVSPIHYEGEIIRLKNSDTININIKYKYKTSCDRCLKDTINEAKTSLLGELRDYTEFNEEENKNNDDMMEDIFYHDKGNFKLYDHIIMEVASSLPMKSLCNKDCKGLCPQCGIDLNEKSCDCADNVIDPRLEKLKEFNIKD